MIIVATALASVVDVVLTGRTELRTLFELLLPAISRSVDFCKLTYADAVAVVTVNPSVDVLPDPS